VSFPKESLIKCDVRIAKWIFVPGKAEEGAYIAVYKRRTTTKPDAKRPSKTDTVLYSALP
jgi:hypothetical protein